jgi:hypothetical protein
MQRKLLIYETTHYEALPGLVELSLDHFDEICIFAAHASVLDNCRHFDAFQNSNIKWVTKQPAESHRKFIKKLFGKLSSGSYSHLFINSLDNNLLYFALKLRRHSNIHTVLNVHCIHDYTTFRYNTIISFSESIAKKILHSRVKYYRVLAPAMPAYLKSFLKDIEIEYIPGMFFNKTGKTDLSHKPFRIVVPGNIEKKRRHYEIIPAVVKILAKTLGSDQQTELVIMGNSNTVYGKELVENIKQAIIHSSLSLITFDKDVSYDVYSRYYYSHIIWSPIRLKMQSLRGIEEINGLSNSAGFIVDFVHYAQPSLIPSMISFSKEFDPLFFTYSTADEAALMLNTFVNDIDILQQRKKNIELIISNYNSNKFRTVFLRLMKL